MKKIIYSVAALITAIITMFACVSCSITPKNDGEEHMVAQSYEKYKAYPVYSGFYADEDSVYKVDKNKEIFNKDLIKYQISHNSELKNTTRIITIDNMTIEGRYSGSVKDPLRFEKYALEYDTYFDVEEGSPFYTFGVSEKTGNLLYMYSIYDVLYEYGDGTETEEEKIAFARELLTEKYGVDLDGYVEYYSFVSVHFTKIVNGYAGYSKYSVSFESLSMDDGTDKYGVTAISFQNHENEFAPFADTQIDKEKIDALVEEAIHDAVDTKEYYVDEYITGHELVVLDGMLFDMVTIVPQVVKYKSNDEPVTERHYSLPFEVMIRLA